VHLNQYIVIKTVQYPHGTVALSSEPVTVLLRYLVTYFPSMLVFSNINNDVAFLCLISW